MKNYVNVSDYTMKNFRTKDYETDHTLKYRSIVKDLNYESCKDILLNYVSKEQLIKKYKEDICFNTKVFNVKNQLDMWNNIGALMIKNPNRTITFKRFSLCNLTCIAKQCARMIIMEDKQL